MAAARDLLDSLSRPPGRGWRDTLAHHGARAVLLVALVLLVQLLFPVAPVPDYPVLEKGMIPQSDIIAEVAFPIPKSDADLASEQADAAAAVAPVFRYSAGAADTMLMQVRTFVAGLDSAASGVSQAEARTRLAGILQSYGLPATPESLALLEDAQNRASLLTSLESTITAELPRGIVSSADAEDSQTPQWRIVREQLNRLPVRHDEWEY